MFTLSKKLKTCLLIVFTIIVIINCKLTLPEFRVTGEYESKITKSIDVLFLVDNTGSMGSEVEEVKSKTLEIINNISKLPLLNGKARFAAIGYRDLSDSVLYPAYIDFTSDYKAVQEEVTKMRAEGGGDMPEAAADAFKRVEILNWNKDAVKLVIWIADAPAHTRNALNIELENYISDSNNNEKKPMFEELYVFSDFNKLPWRPQINNLIEKGIIIHSVLVRDDFETKSIMNEIGKLTRGLVISLESSSILSYLIVGLAAESLDRLRLTEKIESLIEENSDILKNKYLTDRSRIEFLTNLLSDTDKKTDVLELSFKEDSDEVIVDYRTVNVSDINYSILQSNNYPNLFKREINYCYKYMLFCDLTIQVPSSIGIINNFTKSPIPLVSSTINAYSNSGSVLENSNNVFVEVFLKQEFENDSDKLIAANYYSPLPLGAIVFEFKVEINDKVLVGKVLEKEQAEKYYNDAVKKGNVASLLTQESAKQFKLSLGNIEGNAKIKVELKYLIELKDTNKSDTYSSFELRLPVISNNIGDRFNNINVELSFNKNYMNYGLLSYNSLSSNLKVNEEEDKFLLSFIAKDTDFEQALSTMDNTIINHSNELIIDFALDNYVASSNKDVFSGKHVNKTVLTEKNHMYSSLNIDLNNSKLNENSTELKIALVVDVSKSLLYSLKNQEFILKTIETLTNFILSEQQLLNKERNEKENINIELALYTFSNDCSKLATIKSLNIENLRNNMLKSLLDEIEKLTDIKSNKLLISEIGKECYLLVENKNYNRIVYFTDGYIADEEGLLHWSMAYNKNNSINNKRDVKLFFVALGMNLNDEFLKKLEIATYKNVLTLNMNSDNNTNKFKLHDLSKKIMKKKILVSIEINDSNDKVLYSTDIDLGFRYNCSSPYNNYMNYDYEPPVYDEVYMSEEMDIKEDKSIKPDRMKPEIEMYSFEKPEELLIMDDTLEKPIMKDVKTFSKPIKPRFLQDEKRIIDKESSRIKKFDTSPLPPSEFEIPEEVVTHSDHLEELIKPFPYPYIPPPPPFINPNDSKDNCEYDENFKTYDNYKKNITNGIEFDHSYSKELLVDNNLDLSFIFDEDLYDREAILNSSIVVTISSISSEDKEVYKYKISDSIVANVDKNSTEGLNNLSLEEQFQKIVTNKIIQFYQYRFNNLRYLGLKDRVISLGIKNNIMTQFTSFFAVNEIYLDSIYLNYPNVPLEENYIVFHEDYSSDSVREPVLTMPSLSSVGSYSKMSMAYAESAPMRDYDTLEYFEEDMYVDSEPEPELVSDTYEEEDEPEIIEEISEYLNLCNNTNTTNSTNSTANCTKIEDSSEFKRFEDEEFDLSEEESIKTRLLEDKSINFLNSGLNNENRKSNYVRKIFDYIRSFF